MNESTPSPIVLYHGARAWDGPPEVRPGRKKRTEHGPGIYLTTAYVTAQKYAKGGGRVKRIFLDPKLSWIEDARVPLADAVAFVEAHPRLRKRREIVADLRANAGRMGAGDGTIGAYVLNNLMVNYDALVGDAAPALARFFADHGIDAAINQTFSADGAEEDWVVLFNPMKILRHEDVDSRRFDGPRSLPLLRKPRSRIGG